MWLNLYTLSKDFTVERVDLVFHLARDVGNNW